MMAERQTLAQKRARHAWEAVEHVRKNPRDIVAKDYAREAKRLPVRIMTSGLGHAVAFVNAKAQDESGQQRLIYDLAQWLLVERRLHHVGGKADGKAIINAIVTRDADFQRRATEEAQLYLQWLTRFAEAEIDTGEDADH